MNESRPIFIYRAQIPVTLFLASIDKIDKAAAEFPLASVAPLFKTSIVAGTALSLAPSLIFYFIFNHIEFKLKEKEVFLLNVLIQNLHVLGNKSYIIKYILNFKGVITSLWHHNFYGNERIINDILLVIF